MKRGQFLLAALSVVLVAGCSGVSAGVPQVSGGPSAPATVDAAALVQQPSKLVGAWTVEATGVPAGSVLRITDGSESFAGPGMTLALPNCWLQLSYLVSKPNLLAMASGGGSAGCGQDIWGPSFVLETRAFAVDESGVTLLGRDGGVVARLTPRHATGQSECAPRILERP